MEGLTYDEVTAQIEAENELRAELMVASELAERGIMPAVGIGRERRPTLRLREFMRKAWHVLEPKRRFMDNWSIGAVCEHLEAVRAGQIDNLIINTPPRCTKSLTVSVFFFAWTWVDWPESRFLYSAYADVLATRDSLKCRRVITSDWYRMEFGEPFRLMADQNLKTRFQNDRTGYRIATSTSGVGTGEGGDFIIVDDPHKVQEAESEEVRKGVVSWWLETMSTRANDPQWVKRVIMMQRVHEQDVTGEVLARELGYEHLCLPMRFEIDHPYANVRPGLRLPGLEAVGELERLGRPTYTVGRPTKLGFVDPRTRDGELLWPERWPEETVRKLEKELGSYAAAGQLQQRPAPRGGQKFRREWFRLVQALPARGVIWVRYWDKAATAGSGKRTAGVLMGMYREEVGRRWVVASVVKGQWEAVARNKMIRLQAQLDVQGYGAGVQIWIEQEPAGSGKESAEISIRELAGYLVHAETVTGSKDVRADSFAIQAEAGNVDLLRGDWNAEYLEELELFSPAAKFKDQVDASSGAFNKLALMQLQTGLGVPVLQGAHGWGWGGRR